MLQIDIRRIILIYVIQGVIVIYFSLLTNRIFRRNRRRLNLIFGGFFISTIIGLIFNMIYAVININEFVVILHFLSLFFVNFGLIFLLIVNLILLESPIIFSIRRQNAFILLYGILLFFGMLLLILLPLGGEPFPQGGVKVHPSRYLQWHPLFFIYLTSIITCFAIVPIFYTSFKIYSRFETKELKKKWLYYLIGSLGLAIFNLYPVDILNLLTYIMVKEDNLVGLNIARSIISIIGISVILWVSMMYYAIGSKLKK